MAIVLNYAHLVGWYSTAWPAVLLVAAIIITAAVVRNGLFMAKSRYTRFIYRPLMAWGILRIPGFIMRIYVVSGDNGTDLGLYKAAQVVGNIGFFPLIIVLALTATNVGSLIFSWSSAQVLRYRLLAFGSFLVGVACTLGYIFDYLINKPFGYVLQNGETDMVLRELGFSIFLAVTVLVLFFVFYLTWRVEEAVHIAPVHRRGLFRLLVVLGVQACLLVVKLAFTIYRNWNPNNLKDESYYFGIQVLPEFLYMAFFVTHSFKRVFDDIENSAESLELGTHESPVAVAKGTPTQEPHILKA